ncbi:hypothetical protein A4A49_14026 [Nicotiana attenuata]|uniref:Uncharacterized protein n=1 Tax=Nicotiana attenuata TaxID=49451 RepID=A0A1J6IFV0_NICAT|nr:hypothetical protein A4A49_14026 [Nicotiana attenuata]
MGVQHQMEQQAACQNHQLAAKQPTKENISKDQWHTQKKKIFRGFNQRNKPQRLKNSNEQVVDTEVSEPYHISEIELNGEKEAAQQIAEVLNSENPKGVGSCPSLRENTAANDNLRRENISNSAACNNNQLWNQKNVLQQTLIPFQDWELIMDTEQQLIKVFHQDIGKHIIMTFIYATCSSLQKMELWDYLYYLTSDMDMPWVVGGDINVVLHEDEKIGGLPVHPPEYEDFAFCVNPCGLFDLVTTVVH